jgi:hypothetical protein
MSIEQLTYEQLLAERGGLQRPWRQAVLSMIPFAFWRWWDDRSTWKRWHSQWPPRGRKSESDNHDVGTAIWLRSARRLKRFTAPNFCFCTKGTDMREHVLLFCLLGLVLTAAIILMIAPGAVTWALALIE